MLPTAQDVSTEEEEKDEVAESGHSDDEEDIDDINHVALSKCRWIQPRTTWRVELKSFNSHL